MKSKFLVPVAFSIALTGCGSVGAIGFPPMKRDEAPDVMAPVAVSPVQTQNLPPPPGSQQSPYGQSPYGQQPPYGSQPGAPGGMAAANPQPAAPSGGALGRTDLLGGWTIASSGESCQLFMTLTSWTGGYRASTRGCNNEVLKSISAWNLSGSQVVLAGSGGSPVATLNASGGGRFDGQTGQGIPVSFYR